MGCHSSKVALPSASTPERTLLANDSGNVKSPKSTQNTAVPEGTPEAEVQSDLAEAGKADLITPAFMQLPKDKFSQSTEIVQSNLSEAKELQFSQEELAEPVGMPQSITVSFSGERVMAENASAEGVVITSHATDAALPDVEQKEKQDTHEPTSKIHKNPQGWEEEGILFPHEGVRFLIQEFSDALINMDPLPSWKWDNVSTWYEEYLYSVVHHHHDAEEKIYLPWIQGRVSVPAKISAEHPGLMQTMDDLGLLC